MIADPDQYLLDGQRIAALYVHADGVYSGRPDVEVWPEGRDARLYAGPWSVVAHPPCQRWSPLAWMHVARSGRAVGDDGGCFASALAAVERWGGVLEHPARSEAWPRFRLPKPATGGGWSRSIMRPGWACQAEQGWYGHECPKPTWLYYVGDTAPPDLPWGASGATGRIELLPSSGPRRSATPPAFADLLVTMAKASRSVRCGS